MLHQRLIPVPFVVLDLSGNLLRVNCVIYVQSKIPGGAAAPVEPVLFTPLLLTNHTCMFSNNKSKFEWFGVINSGLILFTNCH